MQPAQFGAEGVQKVKFFKRENSRLKQLYIMNKYRGSQVLALAVKNLSPSAGNIRDEGSIPGSGISPWRREWQPTPVFLPGESPWTEEPGGLWSMGSQRVRHE